MIVLRRVEFKKSRVGCCGSIRNDSITPVGPVADFTLFQKEAMSLIEQYGQENYLNTGDEYSLEYFDGKSIDQNFREDGKSIFKFILEGKKWNFYEYGIPQFSVSKLIELKKIWVS